MKKIMILSLLALIIFTITGCVNVTDDNKKSDKVNDDEKTGNLVSGIYSFNSYDKLSEFYNVFVEKNNERFIVADFDITQNVYYIFECDGIDSKVIYDKIYNYDFPNPRFQIETTSFCIYLLDVSSFINELSIISEFTIIANKDNSKMKDIYVNDYLIAVLTYNFDLSYSDIQNISNRFKEALNNVY